MVRIGYRGYTEGALNEDEYATLNIDGAQAAGIDTGAYFFSQAVTEEEAREEARFVLDILDGRALQMPIAYDHEPVHGQAGRANSVERDVLVACARAFCEEIEDAGYSTMVYGNRSDLARFADLDGTVGGARALAAALGDRPVWFAEYDVAAPTAPCDIAMWQYSASGQVAGISTVVDLNILFSAA